MTEIKFNVLIAEDEENIGNFISTILASMYAQTIYKLLSKAFLACILDNGLKLTAFLNSRYVSTPTLFDTSVTNFILSLSSFFYIICFSS